MALWMSLLLIGLQLLFTYASPMQQVFNSAALDATSWLMIGALGLLKFLAVEAGKMVLRRLKARSL